MDENEKFNEALRGMGVNLEGASGATQELVKILGALSKASKDEISAKEAQAKITRALEERAQKLENGMEGAVASAVGFIASLNSATSSIYGSDQAFTSLIPTLDAFASTTKSMITALGELGSGASVAGFSFGKATEGLAKMANVGIDIVTNNAKFQLDTAQKVANAYTDASKAGGHFATGIDTLARNAADAGLPIQTYTKILIKNTEAIGHFGLGVTEGASQLNKMASTIGKTDRKLLTSYGSFEALGEGVAQYMELQAQLGVETKNMSKDQIAGASEYLRRQRELSDLTGKSVEATKKAEQERRNKLDYQLKAAELGKDQQNNLTEGIEMIGKTMSSAAANYAEEYFATGGQVISEANLKWAAMNGAAAKSAEGVIDQINQGRAEFRNSYSRVLKENEPMLTAEAKNNRYMATLSRATQSEILSGMSATGSAIIANRNTLLGITDQTAALEKSRGAEIDSSTENYGKAIDELIRSQRRIDESVIKNMDKMSVLTDFLYERQRKIIEAQDKVTDVINALATGSFAELKKAVGDLALYLVGVKNQDKARSGNPSDQRSSVTNPAPTSAYARGNQPAIPVVRGDSAGPSSPETMDLIKQNRKDVDTMNKRDGEGIAYGPTLTGESGPEAHIKLRNNSIPMDINFGPMLDAMREQTVLQQEVIRELRDTRDIQERILNASY